MALRNRFENKVAIVTGSTEGIGFATAKRIAAEGGSVAISSRNQDKVDAAIQQLKDLGYSKVFGMVCDVSKESDQMDLIKATFDHYGGIDVLVCNAGIQPRGLIIDTTDEDWDQLFQVNVRSAFILCKAALPHLKQRKGSNIVFISSILGYAPNPFAGAYSVSKTAVLGLSNELSQELGQFNIRVNCIAPGAIDTKANKGLLDGGSENPILKDTPLKRFGHTDDVASAVAYVASDEAAFITGSSIVIDGGLLGHI